MRYTVNRSFENIYVRYMRTKGSFDLPTFGTIYRQFLMKYLEGTIYKIFCSKTVKKETKFRFRKAKMLLLKIQLKLSFYLHYTRSIQLLTKILTSLQIIHQNNNK